MGVPLNLISFTFWAFCLTFAQGQECLGGDIVLDNTEPLQKPSYSNGESVKVNCVIGYTGMYKFTCENGKWDKKVDRTCTKKKCGHPGDVSNGDFKLLYGNTEFVFGATVEYTCKKGYDMASRVYQRTCRSNGWDGAVPICEVVKCPPIYVEGDVTASGNTEEGTYGEVIQFHCESSDKKINGMSDIYCKEDGEWSGIVPQCIEITCAPPEIPFMTGELKREYKKEEKLHYRCQNGYKPRQGTPKCIKYGWSLQPECEVITCELRDTTGIVKTEPEGKMFFKVGETVRVTCSERYWIFMSKENYKSFQCQHDGEWDNRPGCEEITCGAPQDDHIYDPYRYFDRSLKLGVKQSYRCLSGYRPVANEATCTKAGWTPRPLCEEITCELRDTTGIVKIEPERKMFFRVGETVRVTCSERHWIIWSKENYKSFQCQHYGQWDNRPGCEEITCRAPQDDHIHDPYGYFDKSLKLGVKQSYMCLSGYRPVANEATCTKSGWTPHPLCEVLTEKKGSCTTPALENGFIGDPPEDENIVYSCNTGYKPYSGDWWEAATCKNDVWSNKLQCIKEDQCGVLPSVQNGHLNETNAGKSAQLVCDRGYKASSALISCNKGIWEIPTCQPSHHDNEEDQCGVLPSVQNGHLNETNAGKSAQLVCDRGYKASSALISCNKGIWEIPTCQPSHHDNEEDQCGALPSVQNGHLNETNAGKSAQLVCEQGYKASSALISCNKGIWEIPTCQPSHHDNVDKPCGSPPKVENMVILSKPHISKVYSSGSYVIYACRENFTINGEEKVFCNNASWGKAPSCEVFCPKPILDNAKLDDKTQVQSRYYNGDRVHYKCDPDYEPQGETTAKCDVHTWIYPKCIKNVQCTKPTKHLQFVTLSDEKKNLFNNKEILTYKCRTPYNVIPVGTLMCENEKWNGTFDCKSRSCPLPPLIDDGHLNIFRKSDDDEITRVSYECPKYFVLSKKQQYYTCQNGKWENPPKCLKPCKITPDIYEEYKIKPITDNYERHSGTDFKLHCKDGWNVGDYGRSSYSMASCKDGALTIEKKCNKENWFGK